MFHNETWGGEKVFQLLSKLAESRDANRDLLELMYVVLALGFEGRYRVIDNGRRSSKRARAARADPAAAARRHPSSALSPRWQGVAAQRRAAASSGCRCGSSAAVAALLLAVVYVGAAAVAQRRTPTRCSPRSQASTPRPAPPAPPPPPPPRRRRRGWRSLLEADIDAGLVQVRDVADRSVVTIQRRRLLRAGQRRSSRRARSR